jgi:uncharacterized membrane protein
MFSQAPAIYSFSEAPAHILFHLAVALCSVLLGAIVLFRRKGNFSHRVLGRAWVLLMFATAISSFFIQARGTFSAIHLLSVTVLISMSYAIFAIRSKRVRGHRIAMICSYASLCVAGVFTLLPYRMLGQRVFPS